MKRILSILIIVASLFGCGISTTKISNQQVLNKLEDLIEVSDFFKLKETYNQNIDQLSETHKLYYSALISNVFNNAEESNKAIDELLEKHGASLTDTMLNELYSTKLLNHVNLYEYSETAKASEFILNNFAALNDSSELENLQNEIKIWEALKDVPRQEIVKTADALIPMTKDKVGLFNIDVSFGDSTKNLLFDTGANFSVMVRSLAKKLNLEITEADFYVTAATGLRVKSDIAIAPELTIAGIIFKNVFFLVLDDKDLSFPQIDYYINGAIGFPVIEAMDEIRVSKDNQIFVPKNPVEYAYNNFALDGLMPIIAAEYNGDTLRFNFDTGATTTSLYPQFYKDYKNQVERNFEKEKFTAGSGGGIIEFEGYIIDKLNLKVADSAAQIDSVRLHIEDIGGAENNFHGNFGQDYIKQFDEMIISFKYASVTFN
ncbi:aspartyl protease family protein [uncultured Draconibacterium sp.]|uniref:aspartyl protease family protein n=1 Tax=uncultured Draconibacterium sp. TaxID=1573823 RepID=UPI0029C78A04|nr:aspartyl protease family protein [uncultured Draconibacterium sp.]